MRSKQCARQTDRQTGILTTGANAGVVSVCVLNILKTRSHSVNLTTLGLQHSSVWSGDQHVLKNKLIYNISKRLHTLTVIRNFVLLWHRGVKSFSEHYSRCVNPTFGSLSPSGRIRTQPEQQRPASLTKRGRNVSTVTGNCSQNCRGIHTGIKRGDDSDQGSEDKHTSDYLTSWLTSTD